MYADFLNVCVHYYSLCSYQWHYHFVLSFVKPQISYLTPVLVFLICIIQRQKRTVREDPVSISAENFIPLNA